MDEKTSTPFVDKVNTLRVQAPNLVGMANNLGLAKELATGSRVIDTCLGAAPCWPPSSWAARAKPRPRRLLPPEDHRRGLHCNENNSFCRPVDKGAPISDVQHILKHLAVPNAGAGLVRAEKISGAKKEPITCLYTLRHWILLKYEIRLRLVKARLE